jgi:hypothetical protein
MGPPKNWSFQVIPGTAEHAAAKPSWEVSDRLIFDGRLVTPGHRLGATG